MTFVRNKSVRAMLSVALFAGAVLSGVAALSTTATAQKAPDFGPNVYIFDPSMSAAQVQATLTSLAAETEFSTNRYAVFFKPGSYSVQASVGYYESIAGLGATPNAVTINGFLTPNFVGPWENVTTIFWRSMENLAINPAQNNGQYAAPDTFQWGVSQAAPLRRVQINGDLDLTDTWCGNASGGFLADSVVTGNVNPCSQQQWYTRNSTLGSWNGGVWNMVFSGVTGAPAQTYPAPPATVLPTTPISREKPFLYIDDAGHYNVFVPALQKNATGASWVNGKTPGYSLPISRFFIAKPTTPVGEINLALALGKSLILTPGVYALNQPIQVLYPDTVVLGLGYATLVPQTGKEAITVLDADGVHIAGLVIDAGPAKSPVLFKMGTGIFGLPLPRGGFFSHSNNPSTLHDVFLRVGGATPGSVTTSLEINSADVILDDVWSWRADHGNGVGWTLNTADHGLIVNGNRVTATGLFVEHYQKEQVVWNGDQGTTIFYQSELPYDPPSQSAWMDESANGYPSYVVTNLARSHQAYGLGIYSYFNQGINIIEDNAMTVPNAKGIAIHDVGTVWLNGSGEITHVINGQGKAVNSGFADQLSPIVSFP